jgi:hypothetical protein
MHIPVKLMVLLVVELLALFAMHVVNAKLFPLPAGALDLSAIICVGTFLVMAVEAMED